MNSPAESIAMRYPTRGYQTRSRASNQTRHSGVGASEDHIEDSPSSEKFGAGAVLPLDRVSYISDVCRLEGCEVDGTRVVGVKGLKRSEAISFVLMKGREEAIDICGRKSKLVKIARHTHGAEEIL